MNDDTIAACGLTECCGFDLSQKHFDKNQEARRANPVMQTLGALPEDIELNSAPLQHRTSRKVLYETPHGSQVLPHSIFTTYIADTPESGAFLKIKPSFKTMTPRRSCKSKTHELLFHTVSSRKTFLKTRAFSLHIPSLKTFLMQSISSLNYPFSSPNSASCILCPLVNTFVQIHAVF